MATPCRQHLCPNLVTSRAMKGYCDNHSEQRSNWTQRSARLGNAHERGYGHAWRKLRVHVLERDGYLCVYCAKANRHVQATDVDHIVPKYKGGTDEMDNLQSLCRKHHAKKTATE